MRTKLPQSINSIKEAQAFLNDLHENNEVFHPEDGAFNVEWETTQVSDEECHQLDKLIAEIYGLPGNDGRHVDPMVFEPCMYLTFLDNKNMRLQIDEWLTTLWDFANSYDWEHISEDVENLLDMEVGESRKILQDKSSLVTRLPDIAEIDLSMVNDKTEAPPVNKDTAIYDMECLLNELEEHFKEIAPDGHWHTKISGVLNAYDSTK